MSSLCRPGRTCMTDPCVPSCPIRLVSSRHPFHPPIQTQFVWPKSRHHSPGKLNREAANRELITTIPNSVRLAHFPSSLSCHSMEAGLRFPWAIPTPGTFHPGRAKSCQIVPNRSRKTFSRVQNCRKSFTISGSSCLSFITPKPPVQHPPSSTPNPASRIVYPASSTQHLVPSIQ
jgi:hypothetical protein